MPEREVCFGRPSHIKGVNNLLFGKNCVKGAKQRVRMINEAGFGYLLTLIDKEIPPKQMGAFAQNRRSAAEPLAVPAEYTSQIYNLPHGGADVDLDIKEFDREDRRENCIQFLDRYGCNLSARLSITLKDVRAILLGDGGQVSDADWVQFYILFGLGAFFAPNVTEGVSAKLYSFINPLSRARGYNWSKFVTDRANEGLHSGLMNNARCVKYAGNMHLVMLYEAAFAIPMPPLHLPATGATRPDADTSEHPDVGFLLLTQGDVESVGQDIPM